MSQNLVCEVKKYFYVDLRTAHLWQAACRRRLAVRRSTLELSTKMMSLDFDEARIIS